MWGLLRKDKSWLIQFPALILNLFALQALNCLLYLSFYEIFFYEGVQMEVSLSVIILKCDGLF